MIMWLVKQVDDSDIAPNLSDGEAKGQAKTTTAAGDDNGAALEGNQVIHGARQELVRVPIEDRLACRRGLLGCHCTIAAWVLALVDVCLEFVDGGVGRLIYLIWYSDLTVVGR